jgi:sugar phosphate isomerase/epimerase
MWPAIGLCWGSVRQCSLLECIDVAATHGFPTLTVPPHIVEQSLSSGETLASLHKRIGNAGVHVAVIDALTRDVPGAARASEVPAVFRDNWRYGLDDLIRMAHALGAPTINVTHYLGKPVTVTEMVDGIAALAERAHRQGIKLSLEFIPDTSIGTLVDAAEIVRRTGAPNVGIMLDTWHLLRTGGSARQIRALPAGMLGGVQLNDRRDDTLPSSYGAVGERSLPGEGVAPLPEIVAAIVKNTPGVCVEVEVFSNELATLSPPAAGTRIAQALAKWQRNCFNQPVPVA